MFKKKSNQGSEFLLTQTGNDLFSKIWFQAFSVSPVFIQHDLHVPLRSPRSRFLTLANLVNAGAQY